jgi:hypothetical protein
MTDNIDTDTAIVKADVANLAVDDPVLKKYATKIRRLRKRAQEDIIEIGRYLDQAQQHADHGTWLTWIEVEFGWSDQTARRFIHVYELSRDSKFNKLLSSNLPLSALYQLAAPKTPEPARKEIADRLEAGDKPSCGEVAKTIAKAKGKAKSPDRAEIKDTGGEASKPAIPNDLSIPPFLLGGEDPSIEQRRAEHAALFAEPADSAGSESTDEVNGTAALLLKVWNESTVEAQQFIRDLVLEEFFAQAGGADIFDRIPADRLDEVCRGFLDKLTPAGMLKAMSDEFGRQLRDKLPTKRKPYKPKKTLNLTANSRAARRDHRSRH